MNTAQPVYWRCRTCGNETSIHETGCRTCEGVRPNLKSIQSMFENMNTQVLNPSAEVVNNHVYNFSNSDDLTPRQINDVVFALSRFDDEIESSNLPEKPKLDLTILLLRILTVICIGITSLVFLTFVVIFVSAIRTMIHG